MKQAAIAFIFLFCFLCGNAQRVQTIVPKQVVAGNAFQIQYIVADPANFENISTPQFDNLRLISGPNYYKGSTTANGKTEFIENITYTVVPLKEGTVKINPVTVKFKNSDDEKTDQVIITVIPQPKASFNALSTYTDINLYAPSSKTDLDKLIEANLFIKTEVDKRVCFLGEALTATFKLYSRLQSTSEVINAPSLYGFSVMDILNINEAHQAVEMINGKVFNTSILRKLQLYPAQTGSLAIDEMQLQNTIEFDDSVTGKKIKVEKMLASNRIAVLVKPLPLKQPGSYTGTVGQFTVSADFQRPKIEANTQGRLIVTIQGKGNFIQFGPPLVQWPKEFDVFDPLVSDELNKNTVPTEGSRKYIFSFTANRVGNFTVPPVSFSFFDPSLRKYKEVSSDSLQFEVVSAVSNEKSSDGKQKVQSYAKRWIYLPVTFILLVLTAILFWKKKKKESVQISLPEKTNYAQKLNDIASSQLTGKQFCFEIQKLLKEVNKEYKLTREHHQQLIAIQNDCQVLIYSDVNSEEKKNDLQKRTEDLLRRVQS